MSVPILEIINLVMKSGFKVCDNISAKAGNKKSKIRVARVDFYIGTDTPQLFLRINAPAVSEKSNDSENSFVSDLFFGIQDGMKASGAAPDNSNNLSLVVCYADESGSSNKRINIQSSIELPDNMVSSFTGFFNAAEEGWKKYSSDTLFSICADKIDIPSAEAIKKDEIIRISKSILFNNENRFHDLLNNWLKARETFISGYAHPLKVNGSAKNSKNHPYSDNTELSSDFKISEWYLIPDLNAVRTYLNAYYALIRETARLSSMGEFALIDSDVEKMFLAISHPDCRIVNNLDGVRFDAVILNPAILNSLYHNIRFLRCFTGMSSDYFDPAEVRSKESLMNHAFMRMAMDKMADNFRFSTVVGGLSGNLRFENEFLIAPREFGESYKVDDTLYLFTGEAAQWFSGIKPIQSTRLFSKICDYFDKNKTAEKNGGKVLVIGANASSTASVDQLNKMLKDAKRKISVEQFYVCSNNTCGISASEGINSVLGKAVKTYDMIFLLDCYGLYVNKRISPRDEYMAYGCAHMLDGPIECMPEDYENDTEKYFEPKKNLFMDAVASICAVYNGSRERRAAFAFKRTARTDVLKYIGELIHKPDNAIRAKQIYIYLAESPSAKVIENDMLSFSDKTVLPVGGGMYETERMTLFRADSRGRQEAPNEPNKPDETNENNSISIQARAVAAAMHSDVDAWFIDAIIKELSLDDSDELRKNIHNIAMHTYLTIDYRRKHKEAFELSYRFTTDWEPPETATENECDGFRRAQQRICDFMGEFLWLSYRTVEGWGNLFNHPLPRGYMYGIIQDIFYITLVRYSLSYSSLLLSTLVDYRSRFLPKRVMPPERDENGKVSVEKIEPVADGGFDSASQVYYSRIMSLLNKPVCNLATDAYISKLAAIAEPSEKKPVCGSEDCDAAAYRRVMASIQYGCETLGCMGSYIYNNSLPN